LNVEGLVEAASAGIGAAVVAVESTRRYWARREARQQAAFRAAVKAIVDDAMLDVIHRQAEFERRQGKHLDRQDQAIAELRRVVEGR
jgi:hypothetical protein